MGLYAKNGCARITRRGEVATSLHNRTQSRNKKAGMGTSCAQRGGSKRQAIARIPGNRPVIPPLSRPVDYPAPYGQRRDTLNAENYRA